MLKIIIFIIIGIPLTLWGIFNVAAAVSLVSQSGLEGATFMGALIGTLVFPSIYLLIGLALLYSAKIVYSDIKAEKSGTAENFKNITK